MPSREWRTMVAKAAAALRGTPADPGPPAGPRDPTEDAEVKALEVSSAASRSNTAGEAPTPSKAVCLVRDGLETAAGWAEAGLPVHASANDGAKESNGAPTKPCAPAEANLGIACGVAAPGMVGEKLGTCCCGEYCGTPYANRGWLSGYPDGWNGNGAAGLLYEAPRNGSPGG